MPCTINAIKATAAPIQSGWIAYLRLARSQAADRQCQQGGKGSQARQPLLQSQTCRNRLCTCDKKPTCSRMHIGGEHHHGAAQATAGERVVPNQIQSRLPHWRAGWPPTCPPRRGTRPRPPCRQSGPGGQQQERIFRAAGAAGRPALTGSRRPTPPVINPSQAPRDAVKSRPIDPTANATSTRPNDPAWQLSRQAHDAAAGSQGQQQRERRPRRWSGFPRGEASWAGAPETRGPPRRSPEASPRFAPSR